MDKAFSIPCRRCHTMVRETDYFCFNCGANLKLAPFVTTAEKQVLLYLGSFFLPPMGFWWGFKYLRQSNEKSKVVGTICVFLTLVSLIITFFVLQDLTNTINKQINNQLNGFIGM